MDRDVENGDVISGNGYMNSHTVYQHNGLKSLMNYNHMYDIEMNDDLRNGDMSSVIGFKIATSSPNLMNKLIWTR